MKLDPSTNGHWILGAVRRHERPLIAYTARITGDLERARDVVQEAFLRLCSQERSRVEGHMAEWLYTVCRNRALDIRRKERRMETMAGNGAEVLESPGPLPQEAMENQEDAERVLAALNALPERHQEVIRLKFQAGLSYREIGQVTGLSVTNVGFLIHTALKALRGRLSSPARNHRDESRIRGGKP